jgi:hypothetical protein
MNQRQAKRAMRKLQDWQRCWAVVGSASCQREALPGDTRCAECKARDATEEK